MRNFFLFVVIVCGLIYWSVDFIRTGKLQGFIDENSDKSWAPKVQFYLGGIYQAATRYEKAELCYNRILEKYSNSEYEIESIYQLGLIYENTKRFQQARDAYKKIMDEYPKYENIKKVEIRLSTVMNY
jgi:tetratricopeptide (TPR) repeat protein